MVSYYGQTTEMYQQQLSGGNAHFQPNSMHPWYAGYRQAPQMVAAPAGPYCLEQEQMWHHAHPAHSVFHNEFPDLIQNVPPGLQHPQHHLDHESQLPASPPITGSDISSPGGQSGNISPQQNHTSRPPPARSPYEWIKKASYQTHPNPGKTRTKDKYRVVYTDHQRIELEKEFTFNNKYITIRRKSELASKLGLSERQIKIWFQNRRAKERKQNKKRVEEKSQIDIVSNGTYQPNLINHPQMQHLEMHSQQTVLPNLVPTQAAVMQRYMDSSHVMKLESSDNDQLG